MSDDERDSPGPSSRGGGAVPDEDLTLPRTTVQKIVSECLPEDVSCTKDVRDLIIECCVEFIRLISSEANEVCDKSAKKTIAPEHVVQALNDLGFGHFVKDVETVLQDHKTIQKTRGEKKTSRLENSGMTAEELQRSQELLFAASKARFEASN